MSKSGYDDRGPDSQVRNIIKQLNEERPSKEKSREVVVRPDGTKVVRVVKKRKVMISGEERARKTRRRLLTGVLVLFVLGGLIAAFFAARMSIMSGESYMQERQEELREAWGAKSVRCVGTRVKGFSFSMESMVVDFPESSMIERVELRNLSASLASASFFSGVLQGDELVIDSADVRMRAGVSKLALPPRSGKELWKFKRISCPKFTFTVGEESTSPLSIKQSEAYAYSPVGGGSSLVVVFEGGTLEMQGWDTANIKSGKVLLSPAALESFSFICSVPDPAVENEELLSRFAIMGGVENGAELAGPYRFQSCNVSFDLLTGRRLSRFFSATTNDKVNGDSSVSSYVMLPFNNQPMHFYGKYAVKDISLFAFPALDVLNKHVRMAHTQTYTPLILKTGTVELKEENGATSLVMAELVDPEKISLKGKVTWDAENKLSGSLEYGIPVNIARSEYLDRFVDHIFKDDGRYAWLVTAVSGSNQAPQDDARSQDEAAEVTRAERKRSVDLDALVDKMVKPSAKTTPETDDGKGKTPATTPQTPAPATPAQTGTPSSLETTVPDSETPSGLQLPTDDVFGPSRKGGGLSLPMDDDFFSGGRK